MSNFRPLLIFFAALMLAVTGARLGQSSPAEAAALKENGLIAFNLSDQPLQMMTMRSDGSHLQTLGTGQYPTWSPDGKKIAFQGLPSEPAKQTFDIFVMNADGTDPLDITDNGASDVLPAWSPDGKKIAFLSDRGQDSQQLWVMDADGGDPQMLTSFDYVVYSPRWSPDGTKILVSGSDLGNLGFDLYTVGADSGDVVDLTNTPSDGEGEGDWAPDGSQIVFVHFFAVAPAGGTSSSIDIMDANGSNRHLLANSGTDSDTPAWPPDGALIAYRADAGTSGVITTIGTDGNGKTPLVAGFAPNWQPLISPVDVEFTQAIQVLQPLAQLQADLAVDGKPPVPMVAGKKGVMRVYINAHSPKVDESFTVKVSGQINESRDVTIGWYCDETVVRLDNQAGCESPDFYFTPPAGNWTVRLVVSKGNGGAVILDETLHLTSVVTAALAVKYLPLCVTLTVGAAPTCPTNFVDTEAPDLIEKGLPDGRWRARIYEARCSRLDVRCANFDLSRGDGSSRRSASAL